MLQQARNWAAVFILVLGSGTLAAQDSLQLRKNQLSVNIFPLLSSLNGQSSVASRFSIQYRRSISPGIFFKADIGVRDLDPGWFSEETLISSTDSTRSTGRFWGNDVAYDVRVGFDWQIKDTKWFAGVNLINGYRADYNSYGIVEEVFDTTYQVWTCADEEDLIGVDPTTSNGTAFCLPAHSASRVFRYYQLGLDLTIGINLPITDRWALSLAYTPVMALDIPMGRELNGDELAKAELDSPIPGMALNFNNNVDLLLRLRF